MSHDHRLGGAHSHAVGVGAGNERRVFWAMCLTGVFAVVEVVGGLLSGSLALLADAGHMATDCIALLLAWLAFRLARTPADSKRSYGYVRFQVLAAFVNGLSLVVIVGWIVFEAVQRIITPVTVIGETMVAVALAGLVPIWWCYTSSAVAVATTSTYAAQRSM